MSSPAGRWHAAAAAGADRAGRHRPGRRLRHRHRRGGRRLSLWLIPFIVVGAFLALAYNLELFGGRFHTDLWFAVAWGGFPALTGWFVEALDLRVESVLLALVCLLLSLAQRRLSTPARELRRRTAAVEGRQVLHDGRALAIDQARLLAPLEGALSALWMAMVLLAVTLVIARL